MASFVARAAWTLLMLAFALCFSTRGAAIPTPSYTLLAGVTGTSYFWTIVSDVMAGNPTVELQFRTAIQNDLQAAAGTDVTVAYKYMVINASSMYLEYDAAVVASSPTEAEVRTRVAADATFPELTAALASLSSSSSLSDVSDLVPTTLAVTNPLTADPNSAASSGYTIVGSVEYDVVVMFSGTPSAWATTLASAGTTVSADIIAAVEQLMDSSKQQNTVKVTEMYVLAADSDKKTMGSGAGGLIVRLNIVCYGTTAMTGRYLSTSEYASVLLLLDTASLTATFQASSGSTASVTVEETTSIAALDVNDKCDSACKGMIAMAAVVAFLAAVCATLAIIAVCCPCGALRTVPDPYAHQQRNKYGVRTEVEEAIDVYGGDEGVESHYPTTAAASRTRNTEPIDQ